MLEIKKNIGLAPYTTFKIGGPAKFFVEVENEEELVEALKYAKDNNLEFFILGGGSNILVSDEGFDGIAIKIRDTKYKTPASPAGRQDTEVECSAGVLLSQIVSESAKAGLAGLEWAVGIPGTVGGAIRGNSRAYGKNMEGIVKSVRALDSNSLEIVAFSKEECEFAYWGSIFKKNPNLIILSAKIELEAGDEESIQAEMKSIIEKRMKSLLKGASPGSFFLNPVVADKNLHCLFEIEKGIKYEDEKLPAGWLIDQAGLRGKKIGGAMVSEKHANFILNTGHASAEDVAMLACFIKQQIRDKFGIELQEEVQYIGF